MAATTSRQEVTAQVCAVLVTFLVLFSAARVLWLQAVVPVDAPVERMQLRWLSREAEELPTLPVVRTERDPRPAAPSAPAARAATAPDPAPVAAMPRLPPAAPVANPAATLYDSQGRVQVPAAAPGLERSNPSSRVFEHRDEMERGVGKRATADLFSKPRAGTVQKRSERMIYGEDIQHAQARRSPEVRFNPRLHERSADLGSEASGDAYKAAPIALEKVPDMRGGASRRLRSAIGELERRYQQCTAAQVSGWMAPVLQHLQALEQVEYRFNNGADPVEAEHSLPSAADSAYNLARRGLWEAERQMRRCTASSG